MDTSMPIGFGKGGGDAGVVVPRTDSNAMCEGFARSIVYSFPSRPFHFQ